MTFENKTVIISGGGSGIGLQVAKQFFANGANVVINGRNKDKLNEAARSIDASETRVIAHAGDISSPATAKALVAKATQIFGGVDILINNAGILRDESLGALNSATIIEQFEVNALAPIQVVDLLSTQLVIGAKIVLITSRMGSVTDNTSGGRYGYRMSKAALNIAGMSLAQDLAGRDISVGLYHPGYVQTEMVGNNGDISATEAATRLVGLINQQDMSQTGLFKHSNGEILPW